MAKIFGDANGVILRFLQSPLEEARFPDPPARTVFVLSFDEDTNRNVVSALNSDWNTHSFVGGILRRNGTAITINPTGLSFRDRAAATTLFEKLETEADLTQAELRMLLRYLFRKGDTT